MSDSKTESILASGFFFELPTENAPSYVKGKVSVNVTTFIEFLNKYKNIGGYVNISLKESVGKKGYAVLDTWKPSERPNLDGAEPQLETTTEQIAPENIPF